MKHLKNISFNIFCSFILAFIIYFLFKNGIIKDYIVGGPIKDFFIDLRIHYIPWFECYDLGLKGEYSQLCEAADYGGYGDVFFLIPFDQNLKLFYLNYLPYITILLFIFTITFLLNPKNKLEYLFVILAVLNPTTLLLMERLNFDIYIFLILVIIALNRIYIFNWLLFIYIFFLKLMPILSGTFIFIENKKRSAFFLLTLVIFFVSISLYYLFSDHSSLKYLQGGSFSGYWYIFGLNTIPKVFKYFGLNYIFCLVVVYLTFIYVLYRFYKSYEINNLIKNRDFFTFKWRLFLLGGNILLLCFLLVSNPAHREVFLILLIPQFLLLNNEKNKFLNLIIYFLIFRYLFLFIYGPANVINSTYYVDDVRYFSGVFLFATFAKGLLDFFLMSVIGAILIKMNFLILKNFFNKLLIDFKF